MFVHLKALTKKKKRKINFFRFLSQRKCWPRIVANTRVLQSKNQIIRRQIIMIILTLMNRDQHDRVKWIPTIYFTTTLKNKRWRFNFSVDFSRRTRLNNPCRLKHPRRKSTKFDRGTWVNNYHWRYRFTL